MVQRVESGGLAVGSRAGATLGDMELMVPVEGGVVWAEHRGAEGVAVVMLHPGWGDSSIWDGLLRGCQRGPGPSDSTPLAMAVRRRRPGRAPR